MNQPGVRSTIKDDDRDITYHVMAYRPLTHVEMTAAVRAFLSQRKKPKLKNGTTVTIVTIIGHDE